MYFHRWPDRAVNSKLQLHCIRDPELLRNDCCRHSTVASHARLSRGRRVPLHTRLTVSVPAFGVPKRVLFGCEGGQGLVGKPASRSLLSAVLNPTFAFKHSLEQRTCITMMNLRWIGKRWTSCIRLALISNSPN